MSLSRRDFLKMGALTTVTAGATACRAVGRQMAQETLPENLVPPQPVPATAPQTAPAAGLPRQDVDPARRFLNRAGYGPRPGDLAHIQKIGLPAYLEEQLDPQNIPDHAADLIARQTALYQMDASQLIEEEPRDATIELLGTTVMRQLYSHRQLYEAMVEFWSDHFNIYLRKNQEMPLVKLLDDRDVIRPHALGHFRELLGASAQSAAMLVYLDNTRNLAASPNENYARELLELHTLGVDGGYTQQDVQELARALTGWSVARRGRKKGQVVFNAGEHDDGAKQILGHTLPAGQGPGDLDQVLDILATHPATTVFIARKLVRRFVADDPPAALVDRAAEVYQVTGGNIKSMLRLIFLSDEFAAAPSKLKRPHTFMISVLRALNTDLTPGRGRELADWMQLLGQTPFMWPPPNGYPDVSTAWTANLLPRWNFALALLHDEIGGMRPPLAAIVAAGSAADSLAALQLFAGLTWGRPLTADEQTLFSAYTGAGPLREPAIQTRLRDCVALMLASPAFQWS
jgi:uncharacterized protein (DUF1800 family)